MGRGRHAADEEFEFDFGYVRNLLIIIAIVAVIIGIIWGIYCFINKMKETKAEPTSAQVENQTESKQEYDILGKIVIDKIEVEQPILDSVEDKALEQGVIKLYGDTLNEMRKFLYRRT